MRRLVLSVPLDDLPSLRAVEDAYVEFVVARCGGNKTRAAQVLGIARETLRIRHQASRPGDLRKGGDIEIAVVDTPS